MTSSPRIFDQEVTAAPCKSACRAHVHATHLPGSYTGPDQLDVGAGLPAGWTVQPRPWQAPPDEDCMWYQCNLCEELVPEYGLQGHRCGA